MKKPLLQNFKYQFLFKVTLIALIVAPYQFYAQVLPLSDPSNSGNWILIPNVSDEFDSGTLDEVKWQIQGKAGVYKSNFIGRAPSQFNPNNVLVENDKLKIRTKWEPGFNFSNTPQDGVAYENITTAALISKQQFQYGYMEIKSKAANAEVTSSFWTTGFQSELDMFEMFGGPKDLGATNNAAWKKRLKFNMISWNPTNDYYLPDGNGPAHTRNIQASNNTADAFHVYGFDWTSEYIKVYIDGVLHSNGTILKSVITNNGTDNDRWVTNVPYWIWFDSETFPWLGVPEESDLTVPVDYEIEYIRVWQTNTISVIGNVNAAEPDTNGEFIVRLPNGILADQDIVVNYTVGGTATEGTDYTTLSKTVTILNGNNSATIPVIIAADEDVEGNETITITLASANVGTINTTPAVINIVDDVTGTILTAGDIAIVGWKAEGAANGAISFMLLKDIEVHTKITFSNRSWKGTQNGWTGDYSVDDVWTWTSGTSYNVGTILKLDSDGLVKRTTGGSEVIVGSMTHNVLGKIDSADDDSDFDLSSTGDSVLIYQVYGSFSEPIDPISTAWITGMNTNGGWETGAGNTFCALPTALTNGTNANAVGTDQDNGVYKKELLGTISSLRASINNSINWITNEDDVNYYLWSYSENVGVNSGDIGSVGTLSVSQLQLLNSISIYPNPINTSVSNHINISAPKAKRIILYNLFGTQLLKVEKTADPFALLISNLNQGIYFMSIISDNTIETRKILIR